MPTISFDGQSFMIDGRRIWLVSGSIHYPRVPQGLWRDRLRAARQAGLNCITTYVFWNLHEPEPGEFNFQGNADLRRFVQMVGEEGMYCILRPGPYVCSEWDFGGLPPWLQTIEDMKIREANGPFLEACQRYTGAVLEQVKDLQVTVNPPHDGSTCGMAGGNGPIVMMQAENEWFCSNDEQGESYLREMVRHLRENGCSVPINVCNNLWQRVDGAIDTWNAASHLTPDLRQLQVIQPEAPRLVTEYWPGWFDQWDGEHNTAKTPQLNYYRLAGILAAGAQYNFYMFHGGTNFGFFGGRTVSGPACFMTTSYDYDAPLLEAGGRGRKYELSKRISTFAGHFANVFAHLYPDEHHATVNPNEDSRGVSVIHQRGTQGDVVFVMRSEEDVQHCDVLLPNGLHIGVDLGNDRAAWFVLNANLSGAAELTYTNLRPFAFIKKKMLVLFGPAGSQGFLAINGAHLDVKVPSGITPNIEEHEGLTVVVLSEVQVDAAYPRAEQLVVGCSGLDAADEPMPHPDFNTIFTVETDGRFSKTTGVKVQKSWKAPQIGDWQIGRVSDYLSGDAEAYRDIDGPTSHEKLGNNFGYGWYRITGPTAAAANSIVPVGGDRLHVFHDGKPDQIIGEGPSAEYGPTKLKLAKTTVVLADNLGRYNYGWGVGNSTGIGADICQVSQIRLGKPKISEITSPEPFELRGFVQGFRRGVRGPAHAIEFETKLTTQQPLILDVEAFPQRFMLYINDEPARLWDRGLCSGRARWYLDHDKELKRGKNTFRFCTFEPYDPDQADLSTHFTLWQGKKRTSRSSWAFAHWTPPDSDSFTDAPKSSIGEPCWFRASFKVNHTDAPLWFEPVGLTKGQMYLNGQNVGRYFVQTHTGKTVPPQSKYYLPEPWLKTDGPNELLIFEEHGRPPWKTKLSYNPMGPYN